MAHRTTLALACLGLVGAGVGLAMRPNRVRWNRRTIQLVEELKHAALAQETMAVTFGGFDQLPEPVAKDLRLALTEGSP